MNDYQVQNIRVILPQGRNLQELIDSWKDEFDTTVIERKKEVNGKKIKESLVILDEKEDD